MDWILHIGTQKTGSKAIQRFLSNHSLPTSELNICFPVSGREGIWHQPIYHELCIGETQKLELAAKEGMASSANIGVISCEALYLLTPPLIKILFRILECAKSQGDQYLLSLSQRRLIIKCYDSSNAALARRYFLAEMNYFQQLNWIS